MPTLQSSLDLSDATAAKLAKIGLRTPEDAALHLPLRYEDETRITPFADAAAGTSCMVEGEVVACEVQSRPRRQLVAQLRDGQNRAFFIRFLNFYPSQRTQLAVGKKVRAFGSVRAGYYGMEMVHPKITVAQASLAETLTPVYPTTAGMNQPALRRIIRRALEKFPPQDTLPESLRRSLNLPPFPDAVHLLHFPPPEYSAGQLLDARLPARRCLKFDELLAQQLSMTLSRRHRQTASALPLTGDGSLTGRLTASLAFTLTRAQQKVFAEIRNDLAQTHPMHRLLQGDVGSGKTIVAALAALIALEAGFQAALMAPTEILAEQHFAKFSQWFAPLGITPVHLSGSLKKKEKNAVKAALASGEIRMAVGTHALFQEDVVFDRLGLAIVDEQHRFGVAQRLALKNKGRQVHQLMMSATPIPRTLAMSFFADMDVSVIDELPPGRTPVQTKLIHHSRRGEVRHLVERTMARGRQVYWVCPLIEESETLQLQTATETYENLQAAFPQYRVGLVHGRLKPAEKAVVMEQFAAGSLQLLVATTVIEVGVDVPNASLMVIEHAERMGLSQLHQLRGRVGRGAEKSACILMFGDALSETARARLKVIYESSDGFEIAYRDLQLRGPGEFLGARQSGVPLLRFADIEADADLLETAKNLAPQLIESAPDAVQAHLDRWLPDWSSYREV